MTELQKIQKSNKGFTGVDLMVAILIIVFFVSIITNAFYSVYNSTQSVERNAQATGYVINVLEIAAKMNYDSLTKEALTQEIAKLDIPSGYRDIQVKEVTKYSDIDTSKKDLIKKVTISLTYSLGKKSENVTISTLITK